MPLRHLPDGTYLVKPPSNNLVVIYSKPGGAVLYSNNPRSLPVTLSVSLTTGHVAKLKIKTGGGGPR